MLATRKGKGGRARLPPPVGIVGFVLGAVVTWLVMPVVSPVSEPLGFRTIPVAGPSPAVRLDDRDADELRLQICARHYIHDAAPEVWIAGVVHVAEPAFYAWVEALLSQQDLVLVEGVEGPASVTSAEGEGLGDFARRIGLVEQPSFDDSHPSWRNSDMSQTDFEEALYAAGADSSYVWSLLYEPDERDVEVLASLDDMGDRFVARARHQLMASLSMHVPVGEQLEDRLYRDVVIGARDAVVLADIEAVARTQPEVETVGVLYGVAHVDDLHERLEAKGWRYREEACVAAMRVGLVEIGLGHVQLRQLRDRMLSARLQGRRRVSE